MSRLGKAEYTIVNHRDDACRIAGGVGRVLNDNLAKAALYQLPEDCGAGSFKKSYAGCSTVLTVYDFVFQESITMDERSEDASLKLNYHLGDSFAWGVGGKRDHYTVEQNQSCIFPGGQMSCSCSFAAGLRYRGLSIKLHPDRYQSVIECFYAADVVQDMLCSRPACKTYRMTASVNELIRQILDCPFCGMMENLYVEGKILELIAVMMNEMVRENGPGIPLLKLSGEDVASLRRVKEILDQRFLEPMTIAGLAKLGLHQYQSF